ncbi:MAG: MlaD family protein, partial [Cyclobacteriaceae bacterium]
VVVNGLAVGRVSKIRLEQEKGFILVELEIKDGFIVGDSTVANLVNSDFLGGKEIRLLVKNIHSPLNDGDTLLSISENMFDEVLDITTDVAGDIDVMIKRINEILLGMKGSGEELNNMIKSTNTFIKSTQYDVSRTTRNLDETLLTTNEAIKTLNSTVKDFGPIIDSTGQFVGNLSQLDLQETLDKTNKMLDNLNATVESFRTNEGTLGKLMTNDSVYNNLNQLLLDLDKLTNHLNEYPKDFFSPLGRKHKKVKKNLN